MYASLLRQLTLTFFMLIFSMAGFSQPLLTRSTFSGAYTLISIAGGATLSSASGDNAFQDLIPIGFTFNYLGNAYSTIGASTNGIVAFTGISASANNMDLYSSSAPNTVLAPWWDDLNVQSGTGSILYQLQGTTGNQSFTIQWTDVNSFYSGSTALLNFQVILYEQGDKIEFRYGAAPTGISNTNESASIGIKSAIGGNGEYIDAVTGSAYTGNGMLSAFNMWPSRFFRFLPGAPPALFAPVTFTVGINGDYYNLSEAVADLNHRGVSGTGTVVFSLIDSVYDETPQHGNNFFPILIGSVNNSSILTSIHFEPSGTSAIIRSPGATAGYCATQSSLTAIGITNEPVIGLIGTHHTSLSTSTGKIVIASSTPNVDRGLLITNSSSVKGTRNCGFINLTIMLDRQNVNSIAIEQTTTGILSTSWGSNSFNLFQSLNISNSYSGIVLSGDASLPDSSTSITDCIIGGIMADDIGNGSSLAYGIYVGNQYAVGIINNLVRNVSVNGNAVCTGIGVEDAWGMANIYGNKIRNIHNNSLAATNNVTGISAAVRTSGTHQLYIFNNFVSGISSSYNGAGSGTNQVIGIYVQSTGGGSAASEINVDFNNVSINTASLLISSACFESGTTSGPVINIRNNVFLNSAAAQVSPASHYCIVAPTANMIGNSGSVSDYNDLFITYPTRGFIGKGNATAYTTLANWQAAMSSDALSLNVDPSFATASDLHILNSALNAAGTSLPWVAVDIDNQVRGTIPDIGADEIFPSDPSPIALINPLPQSCYSANEPVIVRVLNAGNSFIDFTVDTVTVTVEITGVITQTLTVLINDNSRNNGDPLAPGSYADVMMGNINMTTSGTYNFTAFTSFQLDGNPGNDTLGSVSITVSTPQVNITGNMLICDGANTTLNANATGGDGTYSYQWSNGLGTNSSVMVSPSQDSMFYVSITDGCGAFANDSILVQILPDPTAAFTYTVTGSSVAFIDNSQNSSAWAWDFGDMQNSMQQNPTHSYANGTYTVILTSSNGCGSDTATVVITILTTGIDPFSNAGSISVYPNPAKDAITIYFPVTEHDVVIQIEDVNGKLLEKKEIGNTMGGMSFATDISGFESGIYFLRVSSLEQVKVQKLYVEN
ncbi:MAG: T9SS type A sorting domain-containing protein [Bacteroidia bacterium]